MKISQIIISGTIILSFLASSCSKKKSSCYSRKLQMQNKGNGCTFDCPGVTCCDGKNYCNECEAHMQGIEVVK